MTELAELLERAGVAVKPLVWVKAGKVFWSAYMLGSQYGIERQSDSLGHTFLVWFRHGGWSAETVSGYNSTLAQAKASAHAHHAARTLSALTVAPLVPEGSDQLMAAAE